MHTEAWRTTYGGSVPDTYFDEGSITRRTQHWRTVLDPNQQGQNVAVAVVDSYIIGIAHCGLEDGRRKLFALYVLEAFHGTGVGQLLLDTVLTDEPTELWVAQTNRRAMKFYRRNGFEPDGSAQDLLGIDGYVTIRMVR
ncbi:GNAT family N-acetyltransferase [Rhodococcoides fascians]|uniref:GNAT family N-acetyltransferase n=1 Tax=Rhodococcoides fascians TaxID=1828 RepID=UPI000AA4B2BD|nr:GNAT family N-acetyltransferase [Rhodococcus fascians]